MGSKYDDPTSSLKIVITSSAQRVKLSQPFVLEAKLVNAGDESVSLFGRLLWGDPGGLALHVTDQKGLRVEAEQYDHDTVVPSVLRNPESYVVLQPGHFLGVNRTDSPKNLFRRPGVYSLFVEYRSPVPGRYTKSRNVWSREKALIRSAPIRIEVVGQLELGSSVSSVYSGGNIGEHITTALFDGCAVPLSHCRFCLPHL